MSNPDAPAPSPAPTAGLAGDAAVTGESHASRRLHRFRRSGPSARTSGRQWRLVHRGWKGYVAALLATAIAFGLTYEIASSLQKSIALLFVAAITFAAWYGGLGPALLATLASLLLLDYFFFEPVLTFGFDAEDIPTFVVFAGVGGFVAWLSDSVQRAERSALRDNAALVELTSQLEEQTAELEKNRDFLEEAQRSAQLGSWEWDVATNAITWSEEMYRVYGLEPGSEVRYDTYRQFVHPDDRDKVNTAIQETLRTGRPFSYVHRINRPDGEQRWVRGRGKIVTDAQGTVVRMTGSGQDVTESYRASEAQRLLAEASEALASSLDYTTTLNTVANLVVGSIADWCSVAMGDETGRYSNLVMAHRDPVRVKWALEYNRLHPPRVDAPTGVPQVLRTGKPEFYPDVSPERLLASAASEEEVRVLRELNIRSVMIVPMRARGRTLGAITFISSESAHRYSADDLWLAERLANRAAIAIDNARLYDEARVARVEAEHANRAKMDFLAAMSHELRTPINAIAGYSQLMSMGIHGPVTEEQKAALARLDRSQRHLLALVEDVLTFARIEAGRVSMEFEDVSVDRVLRDATELIASQATEKGVTCRYLGHHPDLVIRTDGERLSQIVLNLLTNAVKFTETGGTITVSVHEEPEIVSIAVSDTGVGIPADRFDSIFEPFVQLEQSKEKRASGMGLGLAISRDLARAMGGDLVVTSEVGRGSTFTVRLPRSGP